APPDKTRWNPDPRSDRVLPRVLHRRSRAESKVRGREGSPSTRHKWLSGRLRIYPGSACLRGIPLGEHGFQSTVAPPRLSVWRVIVLCPLPLALPARPV